jgi:hypothetical protein
MGVNIGYKFLKLKLMKNTSHLLFVVFTLLVSCSSPDKTAESSDRPYYVVKKNGEVYIRQNDNIYVVSKESVALENGFTVSPSGRVNFNNGKKVQLIDGEAMYLSGSKEGEIVNAEALLR